MSSSTRQLLLMETCSTGSGRNPLEPAAWAGALSRSPAMAPDQVAGPLRWLAAPPDGGKIRPSSHGGGLPLRQTRLPVIRVWLEPYAIANRLVRNAITPPSSPMRA